MLDRLLQYVAPHYCYGCRKIGMTLCDDCKYNIVYEPYSLCLRCRRPTLVADGSCRLCHAPYSRAWAVGERSDVLERLIDGYKFQHERASSKVLANLLDEVIPVLPKETIVTFVPTSPSHIRQRGFDHAKLTAKQFARIRTLDCANTLRHVSKERQLGANKRARRLQAARAFEVESVCEGTTYLLIDDIFTTGATMEAATALLLKAGAKEAWIAVIARQPLD